MTTDYRQWQPIDRTDEHNDQERDTLVAHHWAEIGPALTGWTWDIRTTTDEGDDTYSVTSGLAADEQAAKDAVAAWEAGA
jgi:hypothetical protein